MHQFCPIDDIFRSTQALANNVRPGRLVLLVQAFVIYDSARVTIGLPGGGKVVVNVLAFLPSDEDPLMGGAIVPQCTSDGMKIRTAFFVANKNMELDLWHANSFSVIVGLVELHSYRHQSFCLVATKESRV